MHRSLCRRNSQKTDISAPCIRAALLAGLVAACSSDTSSPLLDHSASGGSAQGGAVAASGGGGGSQSSAGMTAGGASLGGASLGGASLGGAPASGAGGAPSAGRASSGGAATAAGGATPASGGNGGRAGAASSGGASSGGASSGGASSGVGGKAAGGAAMSGGAGGTKSSAGCGMTTATTGTTQDKTITVGTRDRTYRLSVPADYAADAPLPLIFGLNGVGGDGKGAQSAFKLETNHRAIFVYPDSIYKDSSGTVDWDYTSNGYDVAFFDALIAELTQNYCIDMNRIFSVGVSAGGIMSNMLGCFRGDVLRAIAPASAMMWQNTCKGDVAVMVFCGAQDTFNPCDTDAKGETDFWRARSGCGTDVMPSPINSICNAFQGCTASNDPVLICKHSGGHMWPTGGGDMVWSFFMGL